MSRIWLSQILALLSAVAVAIPVPVPGHGVTMINTLETRDLVTTIGPQLSSGASIYTPNSQDWAQQSSRWSTYSAPTFKFVVVPAAESDIVVTLQYATSHNISFLAQGGGHGYSPTLGVIQNAIMINLEQFNQAVINPYDQTLTIGGATRFDTMINATYAAGRELTTGSCPCVGATGAMLGGGHGRLQGKHGLTADALRSLRVILWNGTIVTASASENSDLFWAMKGAGQNFGVVTSATFETYSQVPNGLHYNADMVFADDKLEQVISVIDRLIPNQPAELALDLIFFANPVTLKPVIYLNLVYAGPREQGRRYSSLFNSTGLLAIDESMLTWPELPYKAAGGSIAAACARGKKQNTYTLNLRTFDVATVQKVYSNFGNFVKANQQAASSLLLFEIFPAKGVDAVAANSAAYANRGKENILAIIEMIYDDDASANVADDWAKAQRSEFEEVSGYDKLYVYQNYAHGDEPIEAIYGYEAWRLRKLKAVKKSYDPKDVFNGYHNIPV